MAVEDGDLVIAEESILDSLAGGWGKVSRLFWVDGRGLQEGLAVGA